jgi:hypothetical protein
MSVYGDDSKLKGTVYEIWASHGGEDVDVSLVGGDVV